MAKKQVFSTGRAGHDLNDFARAAGMRPGIVADIEAGIHQPDNIEQRRLRKAAQMFGSSTDDNIQQT